MITLYTFGPGFGLPDPSPFVMKAEVLLKMSGVPYRTDTRGFGKAPKGKLPYIEDDGVLIADSTFIRRYLQRRYGIDFDAGLSPSERAVAWAFEKMCEEHLYFALVHARWLIDANFDAGPRRFFERAPAPLRPLICALVRRQIRRNLKGQGIGRHTEEEIVELAARDLTALADFLDDKPYLMGDKPCGADAAVFGMVAGALSTCFVTPIRTTAELQPNLVAYRDRLMQKYFPAFETAESRAV